MPVRHEMQAEVLHLPCLWPCFYWQGNSIPLKLLSERDNYLKHTLCGSSMTKGICIRVTIKWVCLLEPLLLPYCLGMLATIVFCNFAVFKSSEIMSKHENV